MEGTPFGRYRLIELLGRGGMGEVWRAHDTEIDRIVALKMLLPHYAQDPEFTERFRREARTAARLDDPHVVPIYDVGEIDGRLYVTMRLVAGVDLQTLLNEGPLEPARAVAIIEQIGAALHHAHQAGLVHRDVKPSNILLANPGRGTDFAYLIDFGIARAADHSALTSANSTMGTWAYMAPERFNTGQADASSDTYALACVLYQCLTGQTPYPGDALEQVAVAHMTAPPPKPSQYHHTVPTALDHVIATGLAKKPHDRYPSTLDMATAARHAVTNPHPAPPTYFGDQTPQRGTPRPLQSVPPPPPTPQPPPPNQVPPPPPAPRERRNRLLIVAVIAALALLLAGGVFAGIRLSQRPTPATPAAPGDPSTTAAVADRGPFTGVYDAAFGAVTDLNDTPAPGAPASSASYAVRSACGPSGCMATAKRLSGDPAFAPDLVFDEVDGRWQAVALAADQCRDAIAEIWEVFVLEPRPDGTLTGAQTRTAANSCIAKRKVTFTRTGDLDDAQQLPDPSALPPRVVSPAEALRGAYHQMRTFPNDLKQQTDFEVRTDCLRTGDRCISFFHEPTGVVEALVFADGAWTLNNEYDTQCPNGSAMHVKKTGRFPLPQPPQDPITLLTGTGHQEQTGGCPVSLDFDETFTRTGD